MPQQARPLQLPGGPASLTLCGVHLKFSAIIKQFLKHYKTKLHIFFYFTGIQFHAAANTRTALQHHVAAFPGLSMRPPEANYLDYTFVNTAFKSLHNASGSQMENCNCCWSFPTTDACSA